MSSSSQTSTTIEPNSTASSVKSIATPFIVYVGVMSLLYLVLLILIITCSIRRCIAFQHNMHRFKLNCDDLEHSALEMREKVKFEERYASIVNDPEIFGSVIDSPVVSMSPEVSME